MQTVEWGLNMLTTGAFTLREAERRAKQARRAMWRSYVPPANAPTKLSGAFTGTVTEVRLQAGGCFSVPLEPTARLCTDLKTNSWQQRLNNDWIPVGDCLTV